jgi:hypothetical protein
MRARQTSTRAVITGRTKRPAIIAAFAAVAALASGCIQARAPGSVASLAIFSSRFVATGAASNVVQTVEGGASPSTTATVPIR